MMAMSYRRTNEPRPLEVEGSTARATGGGDHGPVLRLCASLAMLPLEECAVPERCQTRQCRVCDQDVHWDPKASIPILGPEFIICETCFDEGMRNGLISAH